MSLMEKYGNRAAKNPEVVIALTIIFTIVMGSYVLQLEIETDFEKMQDNEMQAIKNSKLLRNKFSEPQTFFILVKLNTDDSYTIQIDDIRNPLLMQQLHSLETQLNDIPKIQRVFGPPDILLQAVGTIPEDQQTINAVLADAEGTIISKDYAFTIIFLEARIGNDDEKVLAFVDDIEKVIDSIGFPGSVTLQVTGGSLIQTTIFALLLEDLVKTIGIAAIFILIVLIIAYRSPIKGALAVLLLFLSLIWTGGTMQAVGIPLSIITVMVGALIIGIGIDYVIHIINRYDEERKKGKKETKAAGIAVDRVGKAIIATSVTTMVSFLSQMGAGVSMLTQMGIALSLGIFYAMIASLFVLPSLVVIEEKLSVRCRRLIT